MKYLLKGDLHFHSLHSGCHDHVLGQAIDYNTVCGLRAIKELSCVSVGFRELGFEYLAITNHVTVSASTLSASDEELARFFLHLKRINNFKKTNEKGLRILSGVEVDIIDGKGGLSVPNKALEGLDLVIASNHQNISKLSKKNILGGFLGAIRNKKVHVIGHLTRFIKKLDHRDWKQIIEEIEKNKKIIEFNLRAPFGKRILNLIKKRDILISIGSDTHPELIKKEYNSFEDYIRNYHKRGQDALGFLMKEGVSGERIVNTYKLNKIIKLLKNS